MDTLKLVKPSIHYKESFIEAIIEFQNEGSYKNFDSTSPEESFNNFLRKLENKEKGVSLPEGVPKESTRWLVLGNEFIGAVSWMHELVGESSHVEGSVSYGVRPSKRNMGYGTQALKLIIPLVREIGMDRVLVVCDDDNIGSIKVIESNGGVLESKIEVGGQVRRRYWV